MLCPLCTSAFVLSISFIIILYDFRFTHNISRVLPKIMIVLNVYFDQNFIILIKQYLFLCLNNPFCNYDTSKNDSVIKHFLIRTHIAFISKIFLEIFYHLFNNVFCFCFFCLFLTFIFFQFDL